MQAAHRQQADVLQVALCPAPIARRIVDDVRRHFFPATAQVGQQPDLQTRAAHESRFDEIVAEDLTAEGSGSRQARQIAKLGECVQAQDRVMTPIVAFAELPERKSAREHRAAQACRELHEACEQSLAARRNRQRLDDAGFRVRIHHPRQCHDSGAAHDAVRVQHDGVVVGSTPLAYEVRDIAGLASDVLLAASIKNPSACPVTLDERLPRPLLRRADFRLARVREDEKIERRLLRMCTQRRPDDVEARRHARGVLVVDRHDNSRSPA